MPDADQKRQQVDFEVGDFVWAVLTKDCFPVGEYNKLSAKKIGPLEIVEKSNSNAYRLNNTKPYRWGNGYKPSVKNTCLFVYRAQESLKKRPLNQVA
ncbi:hypothetical protein Tco_0955934 [Tanacetum coccineum]|uniref:Tf2-1-like SH3-like domain-containing protein n=1 Tax=Tanacetum coccineum TaxID=301880 RepID=A0ABQ5E8J2_9ASTR